MGLKVEIAALRVELAKKKRDAPYSAKGPSENEAIKHQMEIIKLRQEIADLKRDSQPSIRVSAFDDVFKDLLIKNEELKQTIKGL
jgi:hypothetical protein